MDDSANSHNGMTGVTNGSSQASKWIKDQQNGTGSAETATFLLNLGYSQEDLDGEDGCGDDQIWKENAGRDGGCVDDPPCGSNETWDDGASYSENNKCECDSGYERENGVDSSDCVDKCGNIDNAEWDGSACACDSDQQKLNSGETACINHCKGDDSGSGTTGAQTWDGSQCTCDDSEYILGDTGLCEEQCPNDPSHIDQSWDGSQCACDDADYRMVGSECKQECSDGLDYDNDDTTWDGSQCACPEGQDALTAEDSVEVFDRQGQTYRECLTPQSGTIVWQQIETSWGTCGNWAANRADEGSDTPTSGTVVNNTGGENSGNKYKRETGDQHPCYDGNTYTTEYDQYSSLPTLPEYDQDNSSNSDSDSDSTPDSESQGEDLGEEQGEAGPDSNSDSDADSSTDSDSTTNSDSLHANPDNSNTIEEDLPDVQREGSNSAGEETDGDGGAT